VLHGLEPVYILTDPFNGIFNSRDVDEWGGYWGRSSINSRVPWSQIPPHRVTSWNNIRTCPYANGFRLVKDAEWRFINYLISNEVINNLDEYAWTASNSGGQTHPVGSLRPTVFGLYDFLGNVLEWRNEHVGDLPTRYFRYRDEYEEAFYNRLSFRPLDQNNFRRARTHQGLWPMIKNQQVGFRVARTAESE
jgi:hypothetical protein